MPGNHIKDMHEAQEHPPLSGPLSQAHHDPEPGRSPYVDGGLEADMRASSDAYAAANPEAHIQTTSPAARRGRSWRQMLFYGRRRS